MTDKNTPLNQQAEVFDGNVVFDNVFILNNLDYDFSNNDITTKNLRVTGIATFGTSSTTIDGDGNTIRVGTALTLGHTQGLQFHTQNLHSTGFEVNQVNISGIATIGSDLYLTGALVDTSGSPGATGKLLQSTGSGTEWIAANATSVNNAINVGVNDVSSNSSQHFISFFASTSGNQPNRVDTSLTYTPSTNTMSGINYSGTSTFNNANITGVTTVGTAISFASGAKIYDGAGEFGSAGQVLTSDGTDLHWDDSSNLPAGSSAKIAITDVTSGTPRLLLSTGSGTQKDVLSNSSLTYDTSTQVITGKISSLSNHDTDDLSEGSSNLYHTTARARSAISASGDLNYNSSSGVMSFSAPSAFVQGMIIIWSGNTGDIPTGFKLCDGTFGTPNLTDRFVVGAGAAYSPGSAGGNNSQTLSVDQIPSHDHSLSASGQTDSGGSHFHYSFRSGNHGQLQNGSNMSSNNYPGSGSGRANLYEGYNINSSGSVANVGKTSDHNGHQHNFSLSGNTGAKGGGQSIDIRPKYYALCYIMKT